MLQRIQSIYLVLVAAISGGLPFGFSLWTTNLKKVVFATDDKLYIGLFLISAVLAVISIFGYSKRQNQFVLNRLNIILNFILIGLLVYHLLNLPGGASASENGIGMLLPLFSILFLALANRAIKKDEDLVKSVDRIR